jgi:Ca-activated chloride channel family protein
MRIWIVLVLAFPIIGGGVNRKNKEGAELYQEGKLDEALLAFTQAQVESPDAPEIHYNIGNVHYRKEEMDKALEEYRAALSGSSEVQKRVHFNSGNVHYKAQKFPDAVEAYKRALKIDSDDLEARQNLELSLQKQEEQQQGGGGSGESDENDQDPSQPRSSQNQEQQSDQPQPQDQASDTRDPGGETQPQGISKDEAERILAALAEMEKAEQRKQQQKKKMRVPAKGKDW